MISISKAIQVIGVSLVIAFTGIPIISQNLSDPSEDKVLFDSVIPGMNDLPEMHDSLRIIDLPGSYAECERMLNMPKLPAAFLLNYESTNDDNSSVYEYLVYLDKKLGDSEVMVELGREDVFELGDIKARSKYRDTDLETSEFLYQYRSGEYNMKVLIN